jgi:hypothetical protein
MKTKHTIAALTLLAACGEAGTTTGPARNRQCEVDDDRTRMMIYAD